MKHVDTQRRGLHLVTEADVPEPQAHQPGTKHTAKMAQIGEAVLRFKTLQDSVSRLSDIHHLYN